MCRIVDYGIDATGFCDSAFVEDDYVFGELIRRRQVVRYVEDGNSQIAVHRSQCLKDGSAQGCVDHRNGFVGDDDFGLEHDGPGDHHPLTLTAAELVRVPAERLFGSKPNGP